jgi:hypothetical protein
MNASASRNERLKWIAATLLALMLIGVTAIAYWLPVKRYVVTCRHSQNMSCELQRDTSSEHKSWVIDLGNTAIATVKIQPVRRGSPRVFLYLGSNSADYFAAEFEGGSARANAQTAAAALNDYFSSPNSASVSVVASPPKYLTWLLWGAVTFLFLLVLVIYRQMFTRKQRPN